MESISLLQNKTQKALEVVQISDLHLYADPDGCLLGVNTQESFLEILKLLKANHPCPDVLVVTGDISQDLSEESYRFFVDAMQGFDCPILCLAGNHDEFNLLEAQAAKGQISTTKKIEIDQWQILLAHSQVKGKVHGFIEPNEMQWLDNELAQSSANTLLFTHHHPVYSNTEWIDSIGIKNCEEFTKMLAKHSHLKACGFGHVHQELVIKQDHIDYYSVPSTCVQFKKNSKEFAVSEELPGYRVYHCYPDGSIMTQVHRVDHFKLTLDKSAVGY